MKYQLNISKLEAYMIQKNISGPRMAELLGIDYSFFFRLMNEERNIGGKSLSGLISYCDRQGIDWREFVFVKPTGDSKKSKYRGLRKPRELGREVLLLELKKKHHDNIAFIGHVISSDLMNVLLERVLPHTNKSGLANLMEFMTSNNWGDN